MHVTDVEALKLWISKFVTPLTDAEPLTFAKYVVALLKKEKSKEDLQAICHRDLDIFLNTHTTEFVRELFAVLQTDSYIESSESRSNKEPNPEKNKDLLKSTINHASSRDSHKSKHKSQISEQNNDRDKVKDRYHIEEKKGKSSRSGEIWKEGDDLREKLGGRSRGEDKYKSDDRHIPRKHHDAKEEVKRHSRHKHEDARRPKHRYHLKRSHSRHRNRSESPHHSKYASPSRRHKSRSPSPRSSTIDARYQIRALDGRNHGDQLRSARSPSKHFNSEKSGSVTSESGGEENKHFRHTVPIDQMHLNNICPQFSEKGICMQGPLCRFDHGANPLILKHITSPDQILPAYPGEAGADVGCVPSQPPHLFLRSTIPPGLVQLPYSGMHFLPPNVPPPILQQPQVLAQPPAANPSPLQPPIITHPPPQSMYHYSIMQHPLNPPPIINSKSGESIESIEKKSAVSVKDRLGSKIGNLSTTIELRNLPPHLNNITSINQQFNPFGTIINIQVNHHGDSGCAVVTFSSEDCVDRVLTHPQAFFDNRFIQVVRASTTQPQQQQHHMMVGKIAVKDRLGSVTFRNSPKLSTDRRVVLTTSNKAEDLPNQKDLKKVNQKVDLSKEVLKRKLELNRQRHLLLLKNCEKIKILVKKAEGVAVLQRDIIKQQIKELNEHNEKLKAQLSADASLLKSLPIIRSNSNIKQQLDRAILDAELDLMSGNDSPQLKTKIAFLKLQLSSVRNRSKMGARRGGFRGRYRGHARGRISSQGRDFVSPQQHLLDRRPKQLLVHGFSSLNKPQVLQHFQKLGKIENEADDSLVVTFATRQNAEMAMRSGCKVGEEAVEVSWLGASKSVDNVLRTTLSSPDLDDHTMIELIIEDDDDDESDNEHEVAADEYDEYALLGQDNDEN